MKGNAETLAESYLRANGRDAAVLYRQLVTERCEASKDIRTQQVTFEFADGSQIILDEDKVEVVHAREEAAPHHYTV